MKILINEQSTVSRQLTGQVQADVEGHVKNNTRGISTR